MKKLLVAVLMFAAIGVTEAASLKIESLTWLDINKVILTNSEANITTGGSFNISRQYLTFQGSISDAVKARLTIDLANWSATSAPFWYMLKYAYVDAKISPELVITAGLQKTYFGNLPYWEYPLPVKDATEQHSSVAPTASADLGVSISGSVGGMLNYHLQMLNGEGYKYFNVKDDPTYAVIADVNIMPMDKMLMAGVSFRYNDKESGTSSASALAVYADLKVSGLNVLLQYIALDKVAYATTNFVLGDIISAMVAYDIMPELSAMVRFDMVNPNTSASVTNDSYNTLFVGFGIKPVKGLTIKPMLGYYFGDKYVKNTSATGGNQLELKIQTEYKFGMEIVKDDKKPEPVKPVEAVVPDAGK
ncbi:MAG: hypothetical protein HPY53_02025 [Brevinematales bacterium]|nr:hypothetical protein [Brevinematales bacterium]